MQAVSQAFSLTKPSTDATTVPLPQTQERQAESLTYGIPRTKVPDRRREELIVATESPFFPNFSAAPGRKTRKNSTFSITPSHGTPKNGYWDGSVLLDRKRRGEHDRGKKRAN
jgi:hypothetical protein